MSLTVTNVSELRAKVGRDIGVSDWFDITQERINHFADATEDHQWIHTNAERARQESPFGTPIAHGYLTLSLFSAMATQILRVQNVTMSINYGLNRVRFPAPVLVGSRVRMHAHLDSVDDIPNGFQIILNASIECDRSDKPVCVADTVYRFYQ